MAAYVTVLNCECCVVYITYDPLCVLLYCTVLLSVCSCNKDIIIIIVPDPYDIYSCRTRTGRLANL